MKTVKRLVLTLLFCQGAVLLLGLNLSLRRRYASQQVGPSGFNMFAIMGGNQSKVSRRPFSGGFVRAIMGGVELDLRNTVIDQKPALLETTIVMGGVRLLVPPKWTVDLQVQPMLGGVADLRDQADAPSGSPADLKITGQVLHGRSCHPGPRQR